MLELFLWSGIPEVRILDGLGLSRAGGKNDQTTEIVLGSFWPHNPPRKTSLVEVPDLSSSDTTTVHIPLFTIYIHKYNIHREKRDLSNNPYRTPVVFN